MCRVNLAIQSHKNTRQRRMISKESRARELAKSEEERAQRMQRAREVEVEIKVELDGRWCEGSHL